MMRLIAISCALAISFVSSLGVSAPPSDVADQSEILLRQKSVIETFEKHDKKSFQALVLPSFYRVTNKGTIRSLNDVLLDLDDYSLGEYRMDEIVVSVFSNSTALIRYKFQAQLSFRGRPILPETNLASAVWVRQGDGWKMAVYQEVKISD